MGKIDYKIYPIDSVEKALYILSCLISDVIINLDKYCLYHDEILSLIEKAIDKTTEDIENVVIPEKEYNDIKDKIMYRQMMLLKAIADEQKSSFSYKHFRKFLKDKGYIKNGLGEDINGLLNELLKLRNWTFHNAQSNYSASKEVAKNNLHKQHINNLEMRPMLNPIIINYYTNVSLEEAISLYWHLEKRIVTFQKILSKMKQDYIDIYKSSECSKQGYNVIFFHGKTELFGQDNIQFKINKIDKPRDIYGPIGQISQLSMAIQNKEYDGTSESFEKIMAILKSKNRQEN